MTKYALSFLLLTGSLFAGDYYPLAIGNSWNYVFEQSSVPAESIFVSIPKDTTIGSQHCFIRRWISVKPTIRDTSYSVLFSVNNDVFQIDSPYTISQDDKVAQHVFTPGKTIWNSDSFPVRYLDSTNVKSIYINNCYAVDFTYESDYFASDIGLVKLVFSAFGNTATLSLVDYHIANNPIIRQYSTGLKSNNTKYFAKYVNGKLFIPVFKDNASLAEVFFYTANGRLINKKQIALGIWNTIPTLTPASANIICKCCFLNTDSESFVFLLKPVQ
jgi:hypothetical protein